MSTECNKKEVLRHRKYQGPEADEHLMISGTERSPAGLEHREQREREKEVVGRS